MLAECEYKMKVRNLSMMNDRCNANNNDELHPTQMPQIRRATHQVGYNTISETSYADSDVDSATHSQVIATSPENGEMKLDYKTQLELTGTKVHSESVIVRFHEELHSGNKEIHYQSEKLHNENEEKAENQKN